MILTDSSMWIAWLNGNEGRPSARDLLQVVTCGPVLQEVLQGIRDNRASHELRWSLLALPCLSDPLPRSIYLDAADLYQQGRRRGLTIRSSIDCLIAAIAIENGVPVLHRDRDFTAIANFTKLRALQHWPS